MTNAGEQGEKCGTAPGEVIVRIADEVPPEHRDVIRVGAGPCETLG
jgi:hypothetical protein